ncbi:MAG: hypothetical protein AAGD96_18325, partial [Chloroflexota bacterium]
PVFESRQGPNFYCCLCSNTVRVQTFTSGWVRIPSGKRWGVTGFAPCTLLVKVCVNVCKMQDVNAVI